MDQLEWNLELLKQRRERKEKILRELETVNKDIIESEQYIHKICPHNKITTTYLYIPGSYLERAVQITNHVCTVCGKLMKCETEEGGFN